LVAVTRNAAVYMPSMGQRARTAQVELAGHLE
jgi:hypothetical protein